MGSAEFTPVNGSRGLATPPSVPKKTSPESGHTPRKTTIREEVWAARGVNEPSRLPHFLEMGSVLWLWAWAKHGSLQKSQYVPSFQNTEVNFFSSLLFREFQGIKVFWPSADPAVQGLLRINQTVRSPIQLPSCLIGWVYSGVRRVPGDFSGGISSPGLDWVGRVQSS